MVQRIDKTWLNMEFCTCEIKVSNPLKCDKLTMLIQSSGQGRDSVSLVDNKEKIQEGCRTLEWRRFNLPISWLAIFDLMEFLMNIRGKVNDSSWSLRWWRYLKWEDGEICNHLVNIKASVGIIRVQSNSIKVALGCTWLGNLLFKHVLWYVHIVICEAYTFRTVVLTPLLLIVCMLRVFITFF